MPTTGPDNTGNTLAAWVSAHGSIGHAVAARITDFGYDLDEARLLAAYILELSYDHKHHDDSLRDGTFFTDHDTAGRLIHEALNLSAVIENVAEIATH